MEVAFVQEILFWTMKVFALNVLLGHSKVEIAVLNVWKDVATVGQSIVAYLVLDFLLLTLLWKCVNVGLQIIIRMAPAAHAQEAQSTQ